MRFRSYDSLRLFDVVARYPSFAAAAVDLNLTKGAVSYQIARLEAELGFSLFERRHRGIALTERGERLFRLCDDSFRTLEREIDGLRANPSDRITIGMSTYFASRWLSVRLMRFVARYPHVGLRLQPLIDLIDLRTHDIDMAIRWGKGDWTDLEIEPLLRCPAFPTAGTTIAGQVAGKGLEATLRSVPLLRDRDGSDAWKDWHDAAGLSYRSTLGDLIIPDPNVRVQAVIDGQGMALNDVLVTDELTAGRLTRISGIELAAYGYYLAYPKGALDRRGLRVFRDWIVAEANGSGCRGAGEHETQRR